MYLQINTVKYDADWEIMNIYENLQIVRSQFFIDMLLSFVFSLLWISIGLSVFGFVASKYKWIAIWLLLAICNIRSAIRWVITKVILNYSPLPRPSHNILILGAARDSSVTQTTATWPGYTAGWPRSRPAPPLTAPTTWRQPATSWAPTRPLSPAQRLPKRKRVFWCHNIIKLFFFATHSLSK